jgi:hypothetical protein
MLMSDLGLALNRLMDQPDPAALLSGMSGSDDPYRKVLDELWRKRRELDVAIQAIEQMVTSGGQGTAIERSVVDFLPRRRSQPRVAEAVKSALESFGRPARNAEIKSALVASGYRFVAGDPDVSIVQALNRLVAANEVVKIGRGLWARKS